MRVLVYPEPKCAASKLARAIALAPAAAFSLAFASAGLYPAIAAGAASALAASAVWRKELESLQWGKSVGECLTKFASGDLDYKTDLFCQNPPPPNEYYSYYSYRDDPDPDDYVSYVELLEPGAYHIDTWGCVRALEYVAYGEQCGDMRLMFLDPERACSLQGRATYSDDYAYAEAEFVPTAPGRVRVRLKCDISRRIKAVKLYLSGFKIMSCEDSGTYEKEFDFSGIDEKMAIVTNYSASNQELSNELFKLLKTPVAGLCGGGFALIEVVQRPNYVGYSYGRLDTYTFRPRQKLPRCRNYKPSYYYIHRED